MAYVNINSNVKQPRKPVEDKKQTDLESALELTKTGIGAANYLNTRNERLLSESGYLDLKVPQTESMNLDAKGNLTVPPEFNMFERKPGSGPLRGPEDRIKFTNEGKDYFKELAKGKDVTPEELMMDYVDGLGEESQNLKNMFEFEGMQENKKRKRPVKDFFENIKVFDKTRQNIEDKSKNMLSSIGVEESGFLNNPMTQFVVNPEQAMKRKVADKALNAVGLKPNFLSGLGPGGFLAQMALGMLGQKIFKPHTVVGKIFKGLFG